MRCPDNHGEPRLAPDTEEEWPCQGWATGVGRGQEPPHLLQQRLLRCCLLETDEWQGCAADEDEHRWDTERRSQGDWAGPGQGPRRVVRPWWGPGDSQEWKCQG